MNMKSIHFVIFFILSIFSVDGQYEKQIQYFNSPNCPEGWEKMEGGQFLIGSSENKENRQLNKDGTYSLFNKSYKFGDKGGQMKTIMNASQMPSHTHTFQNNIKVDEVQLYLEFYGDDLYVIRSLKDMQTSSAGGNQPLDNTPEYLVVTQCIFNKPTVITQQQNDSALSNSSIDKVKIQLDTQIDNITKKSSETEKLIYKIQYDLEELKKSPPSDPTYNDKIESIKKDISSFYEDFEDKKGEIQKFSDDKINDLKDVQSENEKSDSSMNQISICALCIGMFGLLINIFHILFKIYSKKESSQIKSSKMKTQKVTPLQNDIENEKK